MSDTVLIPYGDDAGQTARDLIGAAEGLGLDPVHTVKNQPDDGGFRVPEGVAHAAGMGEPDEPEQPAPRKRAAKKTAAKKSAAKK